MTIQPVIPFFWGLKSPLLDDRSSRAEDFWRSQQLEKIHIDVNDEGVGNIIGRGIQTK